MVLYLLNLNSLGSGKIFLLFSVSIKHSLSQDEYRLHMCEKRMLRRMYGSEREEGQEPVENSFTDVMGLIS
jgi:hypothetical protein